MKPSSTILAVLNLIRRSCTPAHNRAVAFAALCLGLVVNGGAVFAADKVADRQAIVDELRARGRSVVIVNLHNEARPGDSLAARTKKFAATQSRVVDALRGSKSRIRHRYSFSPSMILEIHDENTLRALESRQDVKRLRRPETGQGGLTESVPFLGADDLHSDGWTGAGTVVAVLDSGIDDTHPSFAGAVLSDLAFHFLDLGGDYAPGAVDGHGHGTIVSGIIGSRGVDAPVGVAPGTMILPVKVLNDQNTGSQSDWAAGVEYVIQTHLADNGVEVDAINMSLVTFATFDGVCDSSRMEFADACRTARELGISVFACSGNTGSTTEMTLPGCFSSTTSVGSVSGALPDVISSFTSRNALLDLLAPGQSITSTGLGGGQATLSGCSPATPHVSAIACLMREAIPLVSPSVVEDTLKESGVDVPDAPTALTFKRVDASAAMELLFENDCDADGVLNSDEISMGEPDCNSNGVPDACDFENGVLHDFNNDGVADECTELPLFHRGDANDDGELDISDPLFILNLLFVDPVAPACLEATDGNDDGDIDISDPLFILLFLFADGESPPAPGPPSQACSVDPEAVFGGGLGCSGYASCSS